MDESTDTTDTAELAEFVSGVNRDFCVVENFVQLLPMMGTTTGTDILKPLLQCLEAMNSNLSKPVATTTDRAPSMVGKIQVLCLCFKNTWETMELIGTLQTYSVSFIRKHCAQRCYF